MTSGSVAQGVHGSGSRDFDPQERQRVVAAVRTAAASKPLTVEDLVARTGVAGRTVRAILSVVDGDELLLGGTRGYFVADYAEDAAALTGALRSQVASMSARLERRERAAQHLPRRQEQLL